MKLRFSQIAGVFVVSHQAIAHAAADYYDIQNVEKVASTLKRHLIRLERAGELPRGSLFRRGFDLLISKDAFYPLAQVMDFEEDFYQPILVALGDWGDAAALDVQRDIKKITEAA